MVEETLYVVRNEQDLKCRGCKTIHVYLTHACIPIAFTHEELSGWPSGFGQHHHPPDGVMLKRFSEIHKKAEDQVA